MNINAYSSLLFILPTLYAFIVLPFSAVMYGSIACLITSVINHYYEAEYKHIQLADRVTVCSIALYFTVHCLLKIGNKLYANIIYFFALASLVTYVYLHYHPQFYGDYHWLVHVLSITGIMFYIKACSDIPKVVFDIPKVVFDIPKVVFDIPKVVFDIPKVVFDIPISLEKIV